MFYDLFNRPVRYKRPYRRLVELLLILALGGLCLWTSGQIGDLPESQLRLVTRLSLLVSWLFTLQYGYELLLWRLLPARWLHRIDIGLNLLLLVALVLVGRSITPAAPQPFSTLGFSQIVLVLAPSFLLLRLWVISAMALRRRIDAAAAASNA